MSAITHCPDHPDTELSNQEYGRHLTCSQPHGGDIGYRRCINCGGPDASWMTGTCDTCYRISTQENAESQEAYRKRSTERYLLLALRRTVLENDAPPAVRVIDEWIEARS